jgi:hypothetical protein
MKGAGSILRAQKAREHELRDLLYTVAGEHGVAPVELRMANTDKRRRARNDFCYRAARDTRSGMREIAAECGYKEWSGVSYAIRQHCILAGEAARSFLEVRKGVKVGTIDWPALRRCVLERMDARNLNQQAAARRCGVQRRVIQRALEGTPINADDLMSVLLGFGIAPEDIITAPLRALLRQVRS